MTGWVALLAMAGVVAWHTLPHSPTREWAVREWLSVLRVRFASGSFAWFASWFAPTMEGPDDDPVRSDDEMPAARVDGQPVAPRAPNLHGPIGPPVESDAFTELAPGVYRSGGQYDVARPAKVTVADEYRQIGRPALLNPPVKTDGGTTRSRMAAWIKAAHDAGGLSPAAINKQAAERFGVSLRLAQLAAKDARGKR